jgi:bifunctional non-homologous end joining protein LigD
VAIVCRLRGEDEANVMRQALAGMLWSEKALWRQPSARRDDQSLDAGLQGRMDDRREARVVVGRDPVEPRTGCRAAAGRTDPEGSRPWLGALLLAYYDPDNRLVYAGRAGTGIDHAELERLWRRLQPLAISQMPLPADHHKLLAVQAFCNGRGRRRFLEG